MTDSATPRSVYVHVPFCRHRCGYCDFTLVAGRDELIDKYLLALDREMSVVASRPEIETLFVGGGTPTHLAPHQLERLFAIIHERFQLAPDAEVSLEANPLDFCDPQIGKARRDVLNAAGVNRLSLGIQSFDANVLKLLERDHSPEDILHAVNVVREQVTNISFDLIFGAPGQTLSLWKKTLNEAVALSPKHLSTYGLTFEKGTRFWGRRQKGELVQIPEEQEREMYAAAMDQLSAAGYRQYELSNFAWPGFESRHNNVYWTGRSFFGFGPGAAQLIDGRRTVNHRSVTTWIKRTLAGQNAVGEIEKLSPEERAREMFVLGLRRIEGIEKRNFHRQTGYWPADLSKDAIHRHVQSGLLEETEMYLRLTREGRFLADSVVVDCL
ncbi:MAG: radical SAM family heme chaperone HemW [Planctomycetaceae bacterium]